MASMPQLSRRWGRYKYERFDDKTDQASVGKSKIGKVKINCRFLFKQSQWGHIGGSPAGIIYLDLDFDQPEDCRLKSAVVQVTLDDEHKELAGRLPHRPSASSDSGLKFTNHFGPKNIRGGGIPVMDAKRKHFTPFLEAFGMAGIGGIGCDAETTSFQQGSWSFSGQLDSGKRSCFYKVLRWRLTETDLERQTTHANSIHTAFAFEHSKNPFFMKVEVSGKLEKTDGELMHRFKKFSTSFKKDGQAATTLVTFDSPCHFPTRLDELAKGLDLAMQHANVVSKPTVIGKPQGASFQEEDTRSLQSFGDTRGAITSRPRSHGQRRALLTGDQQPMLEGNQARNQLGGTSAQTRDLTNAFFTLASAHSLSCDTASAQSGISQTQTPAATLATVGTTVSSDGSSDTAVEIDTGSIHRAVSSTKLESLPIDTGDLHALLSIPTVIALLQFWVSLMKFCGVNTVAARDRDPGRQWGRDDNVQGKIDVQPEDSRGRVASEHVQ